MVGDVGEQHFSIFGFVIANNCTYSKIENKPRNGSSSSRNGWNNKHETLH